MQPLAFGLVPASTTSNAFDELARWMGENVGVTCTAKTAKTYKELAASVRDGSSDVAWLPPVVYAWLAEAVTPIGSLVRDRQATYAAALVVRDDSPLKELSSLEGAKVRAGWVDPWSAAGYVVPLIELSRKGVDPAAAFAKQTFHGSHDEALRALARGDCDVVATYCRKRGEELEGGWSEVSDLRARVLATFGEIPPDVIATRRNLAVRDYERARDALRRTFADPKGRELARALFGGGELTESVEPGHETLRIAYEGAVAKGLFD
ncbi:MAG: PhnD/SsuA/transferrin family substrate-binding protein [Labilithrix sp.]|nr:PhnD/SsuA/transferrin family substrate-binding protein [Labilithrix sp.]